nr:hypothetical protein [Fusobacterium sp.]
MLAEKKVIIRRLINPVKLPVLIRLTKIAAKTKAGTVLKIKKNDVNIFKMSLFFIIYPDKKGEKSVASITPNKDEEKAIIKVSKILKNMIL